MIWFLVLVGLSLVHSSPEILVPPESVNVIAGDTVIFHCVVRAEELDWLVNKTRADEQTIIDKGFIEGGVNDISETTRERILTVTAFMNYTNTNITCRALNTVNDFGIMFSEPAVLLVQDSLPPNAALSSSLIDPSTVNISWSPPFALPSTSVAKYIISVTSSGTTTNHFTSDSYYVLQLSNITDSPCDKINVTVSRYNTVSGLISLPVITFHPPSVASSGSFSPSVMVDLNETDMLVGVTFSINVSDLCPREYPEHVEIRVFRSNSEALEDENTFPISVSENAIIIVEDAFTLDSNEKYRVEIFFQITDGNFNISGAVNFSTYAVQSVMINESSTFLKVECVFAPNTEATGCEVKIAFSLNNEVVGNETMRANRTGDIALMTFLKVLADVYHLHVFEIEKTGSIVQVDLLAGLLKLPTGQFSSESISRVLSTAPTLFQMVSSTYLISPSVSSSMESEGSDNDSGDDGRRTYLIIIATVVPSTCIIAAGGSIILAVLLVRRYQRWRKNYHDRPSRSVEASYYVCDQYVCVHTHARQVPEDEAVKQEQPQADLPNQPTEETDAGRNMPAQIERQKATLLDGTSVAKFKLRKPLQSSNTEENMLFSNAKLDQEMSDDVSDDDITSTSSSVLLLTKNKEKFEKRLKSLQQKKPDETKKKKVPHSYHTKFDKSTEELILLLMDEDTLDEYSTLDQSEDGNKLEASEFVLKRRRSGFTDPAEDSHMGGFSPGTQDEKNKAEKEYLTDPETFDKVLESSEMIFCKNKSQEQKISSIEKGEVVVSRQSPKTQKKAAPKEKEQNPLYEVVVTTNKPSVTAVQDYSSVSTNKGGVYASLSDFNYAPKPHLTNDSVTYVDSASLFPSWQPPVPPKQNRIGETSQCDPFLGESQKETVINPGGLCTPSERDKKLLF